jgi:hypothetical protein
MLEVDHNQGLTKISVEQQVRRPLRLGIIVDTFDIAAWAAKTLKDIETSTLAEVVLLIKICSNRIATSGGNGVGDEGFLYRIYRRLDDKLFQPQPDAFGPVDLRPILSAPVLEVMPRRNGQYDTFEDADLREIKRYELDIALQFSLHPLGGRALTIARYGVWSHLFDDPLDYRGGPAGFWEVMEARPITGSTLVARTQDSETYDALYCSYAATDKRSVRRSNNNVAWKTASFALRKIRQLYEASESTPLSEYSMDEMGSCFSPQSGPLDNITMVKLLAKHGWRFLRDRLYYFYYVDQWVLYYQITENTSDCLSGFNNYKIILPPKERSYADPFCVEHDGRYFIFLEEEVHGLGKGVISVIEMGPDGRYSKPEVVLEKDYHLSYPFIFFYGGEQFLVPESAANRTVELYRCTSWPGQWEPVDVMLYDVEAVDATIEKIDDTYWMFVNISSTRGASNWDELYLFYADRPFGPWTPHRSNPVKSDVRSARPAGRLFRYKGHLYRPAQDCSRQYGYAISINEIERITQSEYQEREVYRILPNWDRRALATHTLNRAGGLTVIDGRIARRKLP